MKARERALPSPAASFAPTADGGGILASHAIRIRRCSNVSFTTLSPSCVVITLTILSGHVENAMMTAVHLRNYELA